MGHVVTLPQLGVADESAVVSRFYVKEGERVAAGQNLFALETGKSAFDVASEHDGVVLKYLCSVGDELAIQQPVLVIGAAGEAYAQASEAAQAKPVEQQRDIPQFAAAAAQSETAATASDHVLASPRAKALAEKAGVDVARATPSGAENFIIERDVIARLNVPREAFLRQEPPQTKQAPQPAEPDYVPLEYELIPHTLTRRTIAKTMMHSLAASAQLTHTSSFDATGLLAFRKKCKTGKGLSGITIGDMILFAVARVLICFPEMNAHYADDGLRCYERVHLGVAVNTPKGLVVPVIFNAQELSLLDLSGMREMFASKGKEGTLPPEKLTGGTFTVSNLGPFGVEHFTPILNPPQVGILGVNCATLRPRRAPDGSVEFYDAIGLSLTYDHRAVDGAPASRFLKALCDELAAFPLMLAMY